MFRTASYLAWAAGYWARVRILGRELPFIAGLVLNERCNLRCEHCHSPTRDQRDPTADEVLAGLHALARRGVRNLAIEGGEPFLWCDGSRNLEWVVEQARSLGFRAISVYTNGTLPLESSADMLFVSVDGLPETHRALRGCRYEQVMENVARSPHRKIFVNSTVNARNAHELEPFCRAMAAAANVRGIFFFLHTPYYGIDALHLSPERRRRVLLELLRLKRLDLPILNSSAALNAVLRGEWRGPSKLCCVWARGEIIRCCRSVGTPEVCRECGYLGYPELESIMRLRPSALRFALRLMAQPGRDT